MADDRDDRDDRDTIHVALSETPLDPSAVLSRVRSPRAGANVLFAGSTRDSFDGRAVATLRYAAYAPRALQSMRDIAAALQDEFALEGVAIVHRLGTVPIGEDSILVAVSAAHRQAAWAAGEACLERVKARVEVWKQEVFVADGAEGDAQAEGEKVWRANKDATLGLPSDIRASRAATDTATDAAADTAS